MKKICAASWFYLQEAICLEALKMTIPNEVSSDNKPCDNSVCVQPTPHHPKTRRCPRQANYMASLNINILQSFLALNRVG